ncbi:MAG: VWA domain-containing protein, partial [Deltaproteobacteria bacterium]|nr:VWA domain-containing protein [Deltaproteobacteria bacterium]
MIYRGIWVFCLLSSLFGLFFCSPKPETVSESAVEKMQIASQPVVLQARQEEAPLDITAPKTALTIAPLSQEEGAVAVTAPQAPEKIEITLTPPPPVTAQAPQPLPFQPTVVEGGLAVELILDASGSMNGILGSETKINIAKSLLKDLAVQWAALKQPRISFALRIFGSKTPLEANQCDDSELLIPLSPIDLKTVGQKLSEIEAKGSSPLAYALGKAGEDLSAQNEDRVIVLLTDGKDTCQQDICSAARQLYEGHFKIVTHVVGFDLDSADEAPLKCAAQAGKGVFLLARTREELASALDEALRSTVPYNLRLKVLVGGTPLESTITVFKAGTQEVIEQAPSFGIELFRLNPGAYDILIEYSKSIEASKPSKIIKGVELPSLGKVEQEIRFDLATVTLSARDSKGEPAETEYVFYEAGTEVKEASFTSNGEETTLYMAPGNYDLVAERTTPGQ